MPSTKSWPAATALALLSFTALVSPTAAASFGGNYLYTGQTGAQTQIDTAHTSTWSITVGSTFQFDGAKLTMKAGSAATVPVTLTLYNSTDRTGAILCETTLSRASFTGQFNLITFPCSPPPSLTPGSYFATLTSPAPDPQSTAYFIKGYSGSTVATGTGPNDVVPGTNTTDSAGLNLAKEGATAVVSGGVQTYTISIGNSGATRYKKGTILTLRDQLPPGVIATAVSPVDGLDSASCVPLNVAGALLNCTFMLNPGLGADTNTTSGPTLSITATMPTTAGDLTNWASIDPAGGTAYPAPVNCTLPPCAQQTTTIQALPAPLLTIAKSGPATVIAGTSFNYTLSLGNGGTGPLAGGTVVQVADQLPAGVTYVSKAPGPGVTSVVCTPSQTGLVTCYVTLTNSLVNGTAPADGPQFNITATAPTATGPTTNFASVATNGISTPPAPGVNCTTKNCDAALTNVTENSYAANSVIYGVDDAGVVWETDVTSQISTAVLDAKSLLGTGTPPFFNGMAFQATATGGILFWLNSNGAIVAWVRQSGVTGIVATQSQLGGSTSGNPSNGAWYLDSFWYVETVATPRAANTAKLHRASFTDPSTSSSLPTLTGVTSYTIRFANNVLVGFGDIVFSKAGIGVLYIAPKSATGSPASPTAPMFAVRGLAHMIASGSATAVRLRAAGVSTMQLSFDEKGTTLWAHDHNTCRWGTVNTATGAVTDVFQGTVCLRDIS